MYKRQALSRLCGHSGRQNRGITIRSTRSRGPRGFFCLQVDRRGPVIVDVITPEIFGCPSPLKKFVRPLILTESNPYQPPPATKMIQAGKSSPAPPVRASIAAIFAPVCLVTFVIANPWAVRDGFWLRRLVFAFPWFVLSFGIPIYTLSVRGRTRWATWLSFSTLVIFLCLPYTWHFAERVLNQLVPLLFSQ